MNRNNREQTTLTADGTLYMFYHQPFDASCLLSEDNYFHENARLPLPTRGRLRLNMGAKTIANPQRVCVGGEDATCIASNVATSNAMGVFDGVGGWWQQGANSGVYTRELARTTGAYLAQLGPDNLAALRFAIENNPHIGTSTACIAGLTQGYLRGINVEILA